MVWCLLVAFAAAATAQDPSQVVARSVEAERANRQRMAMYLFREDVRQKQFDRDGKFLSQRTLTYDVLILEGRPYHRRVALDGVPLSPEEEARELELMDKVATQRRRNPAARAESERKRRVVPYDQLDRLHTLRLVREERACWVIGGSPKRGARARTADEERLRNSKVTVWIDKATLHRVRMEVSGEHGEHTLFEFGQRDGDIWLIARIVARQRQGKAILETEQVYSNYRRFTSESSVTVQGEGSPPGAAPEL